MTDPAGDHPIPGLSLALRPITPEDTKFLYTVYASTRTEELAVVALASSRPQREPPARRVSE